MFKFEHSYLIRKPVQLFDLFFVSEKSVTIDLVARLAEIKRFEERPDLMARIQRDLPTGGVRFQRRLNSKALVAQLDRVVRRHLSDDES